MNAPLNFAGLSSSGLGVLAGLSTAVLWTATAVCFESSSRRLGSLTVNVLRLAVAAVLFTALSLLRTRQLLPAGLSQDAWFYLGLSGLVGFVIGDVFLFQAFVLIGARLSMLVYCSVPLMTALCGFLFLGENMSGRALLGMAITVAGIAIAVGGKPDTPKDGTGVKAGSRRTAGILMAFGGAVGQAAGLLLAKRGAVGLDSFAATQIRVLAGLLGFLAVLVVAVKARGLGGQLRDAVASGGTAGDRAQLRSLRLALLVMSVGALLGPFLGVSLGLLSTQLLPAGTAATLMSIVPVLLIPVSALAFRERIFLVEIAGALLAVSGVALLAS
ncbi:MAG TPA: DMT family transporter [Polyangia bacterium]|jgi:EamA-like transporter family.|nr:DMT family transporter [Polyangia bacterium]